MINIPFIKYTKVWVTISALTVLTCITLFIFLGLKLGIDFTGGSLTELTFSKSIPAVESMQKTLADLHQPNAVIQKVGDNGYIIRTEFLTEDQHQFILSNLRAEYQTDGNEIHEENFQTIGSVISSQLRQRAIAAIILVNLGIIIYVAYAFRGVSRPVASWKYGVLAIIALIHDVMLVVGVFTLLGHFRGIEIDIGFVVALLTVLGYSVTDTIVVYDRIRENLNHHSAQNFAEMVNMGLNQTLMRSINTTLITLLPLFALYFLGGPTIHNFALALLIGIASGAYSSIFIASPLLVLAQTWRLGKNA
ncbi:MAG TPA: protein translocase subunit SecF [Candidatus Udaeobacter sp.]|nr:protein translocase subunit SecF [Candidatus Udaeobacter sp.]